MFFHIIDIWNFFEKTSFPCVCQRRKIFGNRSDKSDLTPQETPHHGNPKSKFLAFFGARLGVRRRLRSGTKD